MKFSGLLSCYYRDNPNDLEECFLSLKSQSRKADEIVLVKDGPLPQPLESIIERFSEELSIRTISIEQNRGLGYALNLGVKACKYSIIARIDSDDICSSDRFEKQIKEFESDPELDIIGTWISEFEGNPKHIYAYRELPINHLDIFNYAKRRNPLNHMTVAFKREAVLISGNYDPDFKFAQDYLLWANMLKNGCVFRNIPEYLVNARAGVPMLERRGGKNYFSYEIKLQKEFYKLGLINKYEQYTNLAIRGIVRLISNNFRVLVYKKILRK